MSLDIVALARSLPSGQLAALISLVVVASIVLGRLALNSFVGKCPPVWEGVPFVGGLVKFIKGPMWLLTNGYAKFGEVFTVPVAHRRITFLVGPDVVPHFFRARDEEMSQSEVYDFNVPTFGPGVVFDVDQKVRTEQFRFFTEALKKERLQAYVPQFVLEAEQYFSSWGQEGVVDLKAEFCRLITLTAARTLLGREVREQLFEQVADLLHDLDEGMLPISVLFPYLPIPAHNKRDKARQQLRDIFAKIIRARRESGRREEDVLQQFIDAKYQNVYGGRATTEEEITGLLIAVIFAGQHTSSMTSTWTGYRMIGDKGKSFAAAVEEQKRVMREHGNALSFDVLQSMDVLTRNIKEALRMNPPLILLMRYCKQDFAVTTSSGKQFLIPKGDVVAVSPNFNHMLPQVFSEPTKYDPDRYLPPREEDQKNKYGFVGFGADRHGCLGANFAYLQIKSVWSVLLRNFDFELLDPMPEPDYSSMVIGPLPCRVKYTRRKLVA